MRQEMLPPPPPLRGERVEIDSPAGRLAIHVAGNGPPLLLVHSVNAAASAAEMRPLHEHYAERRTVFTPDLPGFGASDRSDRAYTPRLMTDALLAVLAHVRQRRGEAPIDALALSLSCEFLARAAVEAPSAFARLAFVSPTGLNGTTPRRAATGQTRAVPGLLRALRGPGWGGPLFRGLTRPGVIRYFLERTWGGPAIDETLWRDAVAAARHPGAEHAPLHFLSGGLFSADIHTLYEQLAAPVWVAHGTRGDFTDYRGLATLRLARPWRVNVFEGGAMPYFEHPQAFRAAFDGFLREA
jgi:pimeloyl-ACP methyl ester carboxylesterase